MPKLNHLYFRSSASSGINVAASVSVAESTTEDTSNFIAYENI